MNEPKIIILSSILPSFHAIFLLAGGCSLEAPPELEHQAAPSELDEREEPVATELVLTEYLECQADEARDCDAEEQRLTAALGELEPSDEEQEFRSATSVTALCGGGCAAAVVLCSGETCYQQDGVGCACITQGVLVSVADCTTAPLTTYCGGDSPLGCWCDDLCHQFGDCCPNKVEICGPGTSGGPGGCIDCPSPQ